MEKVDGDTLLNNRNPPHHKTKCVVGKIFMVEYDTIGIIPIYHLHFLMQKISYSSHLLSGIYLWPTCILGIYIETVYVSDM